MCMDCDDVGCVQSEWAGSTIACVQRIRRPIPTSSTGTSSTANPPTSTPSSGSTPSYSGTLAGSSPSVTGGTTMTLSSFSGARPSSSQTSGTGPTTVKSTEALTISPTSSSANLGLSSSSAFSWGGPVLVPVVSTSVQASDSQAPKSKVPTSSEY